jgi:hypothetical protein
MLSVALEPESQLKPSCAKAEPKRAIPASTTSQPASSAYAAAHCNALHAVTTHRQRPETLQAHAGRLSSRTSAGNLSRTG